MSDVRVTPGREIVENDDVMTIREQTLGQMTSDESGPAGD
jgi:hypothetical protein